MVLAEDSYLVREGVRRLLETDPGLELTSSCVDLDGLFQAVERDRLEYGLLLWRRRLPVLAGLVALAVILGGALAGEPIHWSSDTLVLAGLLASWTLGRELPLWPTPGWSAVQASAARTAIDVAISIAVVCVTAIAIAGQSPVDAAYFSFFGASALPIGRLAAGYKRRVDAKRLELGAAEAVRASWVERAAAEARVSLAAELHDVIGHSIGAMTLQAGAARLGGCSDRLVAADRCLETLRQCIAPEPGLHPGRQCGRLLWYLFRSTVRATFGRTA